MARFIPPLGDEAHRNGGPTARWKWFVAFALATIVPLGGLMLIGYAVWCRWRERQEAARCDGYDPPDYPGLYHCRTCGCGPELHKKGK